MRLFVGTLYTIENEYEECLQSIKSQTYRKYDHYIYKDLPNKEAHLTLFKSFLDQAANYDTLIKVDADMVLLKDTLFESIVRKLAENPQADILSIGVHDFFSDQMIWSLNAYRNTVRWNINDENLFVDRPDVEANKYLFDDKDLAPAAIHCKNPSPYQAFHYGVHRALKVIQPGQSKKRSNYAHWNSLERTWLNFLRTKDIRLGFACLGSEFTLSGYFMINDLDYSNPIITQTLEKYLKMDPNQIMLEVKRRRLINWGILPSSQRRKILCIIHK